MGRPKNSKNKAREVIVDAPERIAVMPQDEVDLADKGIDLSAAILNRIYHPEDYPHDCPSPRDDQEGFLRWLSTHT